MGRSTLDLRSEVTPDGKLVLSLRRHDLPEPSDGDIVVEMHAAPLHPADIGLLLGPADLASGQTTGQGAGMMTSFVIPTPPARRAAVADGQVAADWQ